MTCSFTWKPHIPINTPHEHFISEIMFKPLEGPQLPKVAINPKVRMQSKFYPSIKISDSYLKN